MARKSFKERREGQKKAFGRINRYVKAQFDDKVGYRFKGAGMYSGSLLMRSLKYVGVILIILSVFMIARGLMDMRNIPEMKKEASRYAAESKNAHRDAVHLKEEREAKDEVLRKFEISDDPEVVRASSAIKDVMEGMFQYKDGEVYDANRIRNMRHFKMDASKLSDVYSDNRESDGSNMIDSKKLKGTLKSIDYYAGDKSGNTLDIVLRVTYSGERKGSGVIPEEKTNIYDVKVDVTDNKITDINKTMRSRTLRNVGVPSKY